MKKDFTPYMEAKRETIAQIKCNPKLSDQQKDELINVYNHDLERLNELQIKFSLQELKRTKEPQYLQIN